MNSINDGGPAFPCDEIATEKGEIARSSGMTLRDYFAAKAMAAFIASYPNGSAPSGPTHGWAIAEDAYEMADAMLKAREE